MEQEQLQEILSAFGLHFQKITSFPPSESVPHGRGPLRFNKLSRNLLFIQKVPGQFLRKLLCRKLVFGGNGPLLRQPVLYRRMHFVAICSQNALSCSTNKMVGRYWSSNSST